jgi:hypothetical protein
MKQDCSLCLAQVYSSLVAMAIEGMIGRESDF